ncbi:MAG: hypothetical protein ACYTG0_05225 [Planctomycetota bacterium]
MASGRAGKHKDAEYSGVESNVQDDFTGAGCTSAIELSPMA